MHSFLRVTDTGTYSAASASSNISNDDSESEFIKTGACFCLCILHLPYLVTKWLVRRFDDAPLLLVMAAMVVLMDDNACVTCAG